MMVDINKKYQTRDGQPVRILCVDGPKRDYPIIGILGKTEHAHTWKADGRNDFGAGNLDLVPVPTRHQAWAWVSDDGRVLGFCDRTRMPMEASCEPNEHVRLVTWED